MDTLINEIRTLQALRDEADNMRQPEADLEAEKKAAMNYYLNLPASFYGEGGHLFPCAINAAFLAGVQYERERMMKEAVEVKVYYDFENRLAVTANLPKDSPHKFCDKVKLVILK